MTCDRCGMVHARDACPIEELARRRRLELLGSEAAERELLATLPRDPFRRPRRAGWVSNYVTRA